MPKSKAASAAREIGPVSRGWQRAAAPVAPFSHATEVDGCVCVTGREPTPPGAPEARMPIGIAAQVRRVMDNLVIVPAGTGLGLQPVVSAPAHLTHLDQDDARFNAVCASQFAAGRLPASTCIGVTALARGARVEVDLRARRRR